MATKHPFKRYTPLHFELPEMERRAAEFRSYYEKRRSIRTFSEQTVPQQIIEDLLMTASSAPSGANKQPWTFCAIADPKLKQQIRQAAEQEEYRNYHGRMSPSWLADLEPFGTDWQKPFLETAPWLIAVFKKPYDLDAAGQKHKNYYVNESVGLACGFLLTAIHHAGLVTLTHTPSPMQFLETILERPPNERAFLLLPVGYPAENVSVPVIAKKTAHEVIHYY